MILMAVKPLLSSSKENPQIQIYKLRYCYHFQKSLFFWFGNNSPKSGCYTSLSLPQQWREAPLLCVWPAWWSGKVVEVTKVTWLIWEMPLIRLPRRFSGRAGNGTAVCGLRGEPRSGSSPAEHLQSPCKKTWRHILLHTSSDLFDHDPKKNLLANFHQTKDIAATQRKREMFWVGS